MNEELGEMKEKGRDDIEQFLRIALKEYEVLKAEQALRIVLRNILLYVTLGIFVGVISFALAGKSSPYTLLVLPWVSLILGWTYLTNEQKISDIGRYIRSELGFRMSSISGNREIEFGWEIAHRSDRRRKRRKIEQLIIDEITFVISGIVALNIFWILVPQLLLAINLLIALELLLLLILGLEIVSYADLARGL